MIESRMPKEYPLRPPPPPIVGWCAHASATTRENQTAERIRIMLWALFLHTYLSFVERLGKGKRCPVGGAQKAHLSEFDLVLTACAQRTRLSTFTDPLLRQLLASSEKVVVVVTENRSPQEGGASVNKYSQYMWIKFSVISINRNGGALRATAG